ncbi:MAG: response regulator [Phycisphaerales bacterium]|nr:response regulator [Phycisphaerales bacterium]
MEIRALIVEDDDRIVRSIEDALYSLGHACVSVASQEEALAALGEGQFDYVLLDLHIPARSGRGGASIDCGVNLLRQIRKRFSAVELPVIAITAYAPECVNLSTELYRLGVNEFVAKPFEETGRTLPSVIRKVLEPLTKSAEVRSDSQAEAASLKPFEGGELVFHPDRVELCGVRVCGDASSGIMRKILDTLREKHDSGRYRGFSGDELAQKVGAIRGQNAAAEAILAFRDAVQKRLRLGLGVDCGRQDVIENVDRIGYRFTSKIIVREASEAGCRHSESDGMSRLKGAASDDPVKLTDDPVFRSGNGHCHGRKAPESLPVAAAGDTDDPVNDPVTEDGAGQPLVVVLNVRHQWALAQMKAGRQVRRRDIEREFKVSRATAKRDLADLGDQIEFTGPPKTGYYRLKRMPHQAQARARRSASRQ